LYDYPINLFVASFIGTPQMNFITATLAKKGEDYSLDFGSHSIKLPAAKVTEELKGYEGKEVVMGIRPEDIHDQEVYLTSMPEGIVNADVEVVEMMGAETYVYFVVDGNNATARVKSSSTIQSGDSVKLVFDVNKIHIFDKETEKTIIN